jgi:hypothetical protein
MVNKGLSTRINAVGTKLLHSTGFQIFNIDGIVDSLITVTPVNAGVQNSLKPMDSVYSDCVVIQKSV